MLETGYSGFGVNTMPTDALAPKVARVSAGMVLTVGQTTRIVVPELISCTWTKSNPRYDSKCVYTFYDLWNNSTG